MHFDCSLQEVLHICLKLAPRYCSSFEILARIGPIAHDLALPTYIKVDIVFHVSLLKKLMRTFALLSK